MTSTFEHLQTQSIDTLNLKIEAYQHTKTGAVHYHLNTEISENVFLVALRTLPTDSTGVAHILEHTALCGSERFPVRDPFFMMIRRSLNTFMNAFTSSDWTAYPFATQNRKDFDNLLEVYLDAVFFSRLDPLDFAQEGHRMEFTEADNKESELVFKGVVFNEMKGAMSSINSTLWQAISKHLQEGTTYENNSGGEPLDIPNLSHEALVDFYKKHYHPSNAIFMTFGDIPAQVHQEKFESLVLNRFEKQTEILRAEKQQRFSKPKIAQETYAFTNKQDTPDDKHYFLLSWLLGDSTNLQDSLEAQLMSGVLLENSSAPLQKYLETSDLGSSPSSMCGIDTSSKEITFSCGIEGGKAEGIEAFEKEVLDLFQNIVVNGVDQSSVESILHQLELGQREITGNSYPYGLSLMLAALPAALHDGDPIKMLDLDNVLNQLREDINDPQYIPNLVQKWLIDNTHRVRLLVKPDINLQDLKNEQEKAHLSETAKQLTDAEKTAIIKQTSALAERQEQEDDPDILPKLALTDIPKTISFPNWKKVNDITFFYPKATNGLIYQDIRFKLPMLDIDELKLLPLLTSCLTELGASQLSYLDIQKQQSASTGGINAFSHIRLNAKQQLHAYWGVSSKSLNSNYSDMLSLLKNTSQHARFDEEQRIRELIQQIRSSAERSITGSGHALAMAAAASAHNELAAHQHIQSGLVSIQSIKALDDALNDDTELSILCQRFQALYNKIKTQADDVLLVSEEHQLESISPQLKTILSNASATKSGHFVFKPLSKELTPSKKQVWLTQTQVNFCAKAFPSVHYTHSDAPALNVLAHFLRNGFLHRTIREQGGAYGGGASQDNQLGVFKFYSYRDPRMTETLNDFDASIEWLLNEQHDQNALQEAIFTVVSAIDKPSSPSGDARQHHSKYLSGTTNEQQSAFREGVLNTSLKQLKAVANKYLKNNLNSASTAIISSEANINELDEALESQGFIIDTV